MTASLRCRTCKKKIIISFVHLAAIQYMHASVHMYVLAYV